MALDEILEQLRECLCERLAQTSGGSPCNCCVIHAPGPPLGRDDPFGDACKCGIAWVRMVEIVPRTPSRVQRKLANGQACATEGHLNAVIELGVLRCTNVTKTTKDMCECLSAHAANASHDMLALIAVATCCPVGATWERVVPIGNAECAGSSLRLTIGLNMCIDCGDSPGESP